MSSKTKTKTQQTNTLPDWLISPYQQSLGAAQQAAAQPAIGTGTQAAINRTFQNAAGTSALGNQALGTLSGMANGNFGNSALTQAANGDMLNANPFIADGRPISTSGALNGFAADGGGVTSSGPLSDALNGFALDGGGVTQGGTVSTALNGFRDNGGLDTSYIGDSLLNRTANGDFLTADSNPYIADVARRGAEAAGAAINTQFGAGGRSGGSGLYAQLFAQGTADAANNVFAQNYANERQLQQGAQGTLLSAMAGARENALGRQLSAGNAIFGAENDLSARNQAAQEAALARKFGAAGSIFAGQNDLSARNQAAQEAALGRRLSAAGSMYAGENAASENAASRRYNAYDAERSRQLNADNTLLSARLNASGQLPSIISAILNGDAQAIAAGQYQDNADLDRQARYQAILSGIAAPFGMSSGTSTQKTGGLGSVLGSIAQIGGAATSLFGGGGLTSLFGGAAPALANGKATATIAGKY